MFKTKLCNSYGKPVCLYGPGCQYAHTIQEMYHHRSRVNREFLANQYENTHPFPDTPPPLSPEPNTPTAHPKTRYNSQSTKANTLISPTLESLTKGQSLFDNDLLNIYSPLPENIQLGCILNHFGNFKLDKDTYHKQQLWENIPPCKNQSPKTDQS